MPMREQSRIKADTVAEECTCEECHERGCPFPAPAPESSAPPRCCAECSSLLARAGEMLLEAERDALRKYYIEASTEAEQLRAKLAEATASVRSMREAAANVARDQVKYLESIGLTEFGDGALNKARTILAAIEALPLGTGTATDAGGEETQCRMCGWPLEVHALAAQADAIKAAVALAVDKERKRCLAWVSWVEGAEEGGIELRAHIRSGEDAPGAVTSAKGGE